jgi:hypothetical protein
MCFYSFWPSPQNYSITIVQSQYSPSSDWFINATQKDSSQGGTATYKTDNSSPAETTQTPLLSAKSTSPVNTKTHSTLYFAGNMKYEPQNDD